jgi:hypothetical protein
MSTHGALRLQHLDSEFRLAAPPCPHPLETGYSDILPVVAFNSVLKD